MDLLVGKTRWHVAGHAHDDHPKAICGAPVPNEDTWWIDDDDPPPPGVCGNCRRIAWPTTPAETEEES